MSSWWGETPAGLLATDRGFPGDAELADRLAIQQEDHRTWRAEYEARMDEVDARLRAEDKLDLPWRVKRAEQERLAAELRSRGQWVNIEHIVPKELAPLHARQAMRQVEVGTMTPDGADETWGRMARAHAEQVGQAEAMRARIMGPRQPLPPGVEAL